MHLFHQEHCFTLFLQEQLKYHIQNHVCRNYHSFWLFDFFIKVKKHPFLLGPGLQSRYMTRCSDRAMMIRISHFFFFLTQLEKKNKQQQQKGFQFFQRQNGVLNMYVFEKKKTSFVFCWQ